MSAPDSRSFLPLLGLSLLLGAPSALAHLDPGTCLATTEVVLDHVTMISGDETGGEEIRIYTNVSTVGHWKQESFFAFADDENKGLTRDEYDEKKKQGEDNPHGDQPIVGHTIYYHVNCLPHEPFNFTFEMWDDDSWDIDEILETIREILDLPGMPAEAKLWGGIGVAIAELASKLSQGSRDNHSSFQVRGKHYANGQHTEPGTLECCNDQGWKVGEHGSDFVFTVKKESAGACNLENWEDAMAAFLRQLKVEKNLEKKLQDAYENLLKKVRDREEKKKKDKDDVSRSEGRDSLEALQEAVVESRAQVDAVLVDVAETWTGPEGTIPVRQFVDLSKLKYWADETQNIDGIPLVASKEADTCPAPGAVSAPRTAQITFTSIGPGDSITFSREYVRGTATVTFTAVEEETPPPETDVGENGGYPLLAFAGAVASGTHVIVSGEEGGAVDVVTGPTEPAIVTGGRGSFVFEAGTDNPVTGVGITDEAAPGADAEWVASLQRADGSVETAFDVVGLPMEACGDGQLDFAATTADGTTEEIAKPVMCISYRMQQTTRVGETVPLQATIAGVDPATPVEFTFSPNPEQVLIEPQSVTRTVGEINSGEPIAGVTSQAPGDYAFDVTVRLVEKE